MDLTWDNEEIADEALTAENLKGLMSMEVSALTDGAHTTQDGPAWLEEQQASGDHTESSMPSLAQAASPESSQSRNVHQFIADIAMIPSSSISQFETPSRIVAHEPSFSTYVQHLDPAGMPCDNAATTSDSPVTPAPNMDVIGFVPVITKRSQPASQATGWPHDSLPELGRRDLDSARFNIMALDSQVGGIDVLSAASRLLSGEHVELDASLSVQDQHVRDLFTVAESVEQQPSGWTSSEPPTYAKHTGHTQISGGQGHSAAGNVQSLQPSTPESLGPINPLITLPATATATTAATPVNGVSRKAQANAGQTAAVSLPLVGEAHKPIRCLWIACGGAFTDKVVRTTGCAQAACSGLPQPASAWEATVAALWRKPQHASPSTSACTSRRQSGPIRMVVGHSNAHSSTAGDALQPPEAQPTVSWRTYIHGFGNHDMEERYVQFKNRLHASLDAVAMLFMVALYLMLMCQVGEMHALLMSLGSMQSYSPAVTSAYMCTVCIDGHILQFADR